ncbi:MAG: TonB-dependent receptor [Terriglobia bacterium]|nr:TonB-dependent receptor [Terriglobia bacterium]
MKTNRELFRVLVLLVLFAVSAVAQVSTADLRVAVRDVKGAVIKNATVTVKSAAQGFERTQSANVDGDYQFRALPPGRYEVTITAPGFAKGVANNLVITVGQIAELPVTLELATVKEEVTVSTEAELVETQQSSSSTTIAQTSIDNLPINGRNYINFALTNSQLSRDTTPSIGAAPTSGINAGGQRARGNQVNVDGMDAVDNSTNGIRSTVSQEAVQEFQLQTEGYTAEYGRASGAVINIVTKSGTNEFHGSAYGYLRNRYIQATNPFSTVYQPAYTRTQAGIALGGPIKKDRTYYFFSFETTRRNESGYTSIGQDNFGLTSTADITKYMNAYYAGHGIPQNLPAGTIVVPVTPQQAAFLNAAPVTPDTIGYAFLVGGSSTVALTGQNGVTPYLGASPSSFGYFITDQASGQQVPVSLPASYVPLNTVGGNFPVGELTDIYSLRLDHRLTNNQNLSMRVGASPSQISGIQVNAQGPQNFGQNAWSRTSRQDYHDWSINAMHSWTIGSNKVNEFRFQYSRRGLLYSYANTPDGAKVGVNIPGVAFFGREPFSFVKRTEKRYEVTDHFSLTKGTHNMKWGVDVNYLPLEADFTVNFGGVYDFGDLNLAPGVPTLSAVQAYGAGMPQTFIQGVGNPHDKFSNTALAGFWEDSWRVTHNFTLNYGVRYDVELTPTFAATTPEAAAAQNALGITQGIPRDYNNVAPRIGIAWDPKGDGKTVIRSSFGLFYDHPLLALAFDSDVADGSQAPQIGLGFGIPSQGCTLSAANLFTGLFSTCPLAPELNYLPEEQRFNSTPNAPTAWANQAFLTAGPGGGPIPLTLLPFGLPTAKNFVYPYSNQVTFGIEHDLGHDMALSLNYNFVGGRHLNRPINVNAVRTDLLIQNWRNALAAGDPGAQLSPLLVGSVGGVAPCGVSPTGAPWIAPAIVSFFRPSGMNPSYLGQAPYGIGGTQCETLGNGLLQAYGLGVGVPVPFSDMLGNFSSGSSVYHGFTANLKKRFSKNYEFLASYTWSHAIDDSTDLQTPLAPQDNYNPSAERSTSLFDQRHRFVFSAVVQSGHRAGGFAGHLMNDWTVAPIIEIGSGRPFNIITGVDNNFDFGTLTDRPSMATAGQTNSCGFTAAASKFSPTGYLIAPCWMDGVFTGNLPRNSGIRPKTVFTDMRVSKRISLTERVKLDAIMDGFNLINRFNVADVNPLWDQAGKPTAAFDPRQFQFALRLSW